MINELELTIKLNLSWRDKPLEASVSLKPGFQMYYEAGELAAFEKQIGLSEETAEIQCFKLCLSEVFSQECFDSIRDVIVKKLREIDESPMGF